MNEDSVTNNKLKLIQEKFGKEIIKFLKDSVPFCGKKLYKLSKDFFKKNDVLATEYMSYVLGIDIYWKDYVYRGSGCDCWNDRRSCKECEDCQEEEEIRENCKLSRKENEKIDKDIESLKEKEIPILVREEIICSVCQRNLLDNELDEISGTRKNSEDMKWFCKKCQEKEKILVSNKNASVEKELLLEKVRQTISDLNNLSKFVSERKNQEDRFDKLAWIMDYENILVEKLKTLTQKLTNLKISDI